MITLEISSTAIRLMETAGRRVIRWASRSLEPGIFDNEVILDPPALGTVVKQLMSSSGINGKDVTASVSGLYSLSRTVMVTSPSGVAVTQEAVLEAAREVMPFSEDKLYLSWQTIATDENRQQVLVVGVPRDVIDDEIRALRTAGINPRILDLKAMALARAVNREQALIFNIEPSSFDIVMVVNSIPEITRAMVWPQEDLTVEDRVEHLRANLEMVVGFYNSHHPDTPLAPATPLLVTGYMSENLTLMEKLQARVGYPIEPLAPPLEYPAHLPISQYAVNIGLALKGTVPSKNLERGGFSLPDINLLPEIYRPRKLSSRQIYFFGSIIAAIVLLFPLYQLTTGAMGKTADLKARYTVVNNELQMRQVEIRNREPLQKAINDYNTIVDMGGGFTEDLMVIKSLAEELGVKLEAISHEGSNIAFTGEADDYITFRKYLAALEESGRFSKVTPPPEQFPYNTGGSIELEPKAR